MQNVPWMLVWMKSAAPVMERSTWLSAARCITASGRNSAIAVRMRGRSQISASRERSPPRRSHARQAADIGLEELEAVLPLAVADRAAVAGIGQLVDDQHGGAALPHEK